MGLSWDKEERKRRRAENNSQFKAKMEAAKTKPESTATPAPASSAPVVPPNDWWLMGLSRGHRQRAKTYEEETRAWIAEVKRINSEAEAARSRGEEPVVVLPPKPAAPPTLAFGEN